MMSSKITFILLLVLLLQSTTKCADENGGAGGSGECSGSDEEGSGNSETKQADENGGAGGTEECSGSDEEGSGNAGAPQPDKYSSCDILCYCSNNGEPQCVQENKKSQPKPQPKLQPMPQPKPQPKPQSKKQPKPQNKPKSEVPKPDSDSNKPEKCNYCIRPQCNPAACTDAPNFDAQKDAEALRGAVKGLGTDETTIINILTHRSDDQIEEIRIAYQGEGKALDTDIAGDTSFKTKELLMALLTPRPTFYADELERALKEEDTSTLVEIMTSLSNCAIQEVGAAYVQKYHKALADAIRAATCLNFETFLVELSKGKRDKNQNVDVNAAKADADALIQAGVKNWITDQKTFIMIFTKRSIPQLKEVIKQYNRERPQTKIKHDIKKATTDKLQEGLLTLVKNVENQPGYFADELEGSLNKLFGIGIADNKKLVRIMRGRCGVDLGDIRDAYPKNHDNKQLADRLSKKTVMDYEEALQAMLQ